MRSLRPPPQWLSTWGPVVVWAGLIFGFSAAPGLGTGLGTWDVVLRKLAHLAEYAVLGLLLGRAIVRRTLAAVAGIAYAGTDELHQHFVPGRQAALRDVAIDAAGVVTGVLFVRALRRRHSSELDGDVLLVQSDTWNERR
jgi:hypothetical protein